MDENEYIFDPNRELSDIAKSAREMVEVQRHCRGHLVQISQSCKTTADALVQIRNLLAGLMILGLLAAVVSIILARL